VFGHWWTEPARDEGGRVRLVVSHLERPTDEAVSSVSAEGRRLLRFLQPGFEVDEVRFVPLDGAA
jgi:hypothetical protein